MEGAVLDETYHDVVIPGLEVSLDGASHPCKRATQDRRSVGRIAHGEVVEGLVARSGEGTCYRLLLRAQHADGKRTGDGDGLEGMGVAFQTHENEGRLERH
jgi:hypothetical protein